GALHELVDLGAHRGLHDVQQVARVDVELEALGAADVERADAPLVVGRDRHGGQDALDLLLAEALLGQALARAPRDQLLGARAGLHALRLHTGQRARAAPGHYGGAVERVDLLRRDARGRRSEGLGVARL